MSIEQLSDGYRSILSMTFELIRQLSIAYGPDSVFDEHPHKVVCEGVVLIDEIDVHLHPTWHRRIGLWFRKHFPNIQFLVSTHSPILPGRGRRQRLQAAATRLSRRPARWWKGPDSGGCSMATCWTLTGQEAFGPEVTRSDESKAMSQRLAELNVKDVRDGLTAEEKKKHDKLREAMPTEAASVG